MSGHTSPVLCFAWNEFILSSGSANGAINHYDVRVQDHKVSTIPDGHDGLAVCGLTWSPGHRYLASGGNDNAVRIWVPAAGTEEGRAMKDGAQPFTVFTQHQAAVKALAWCPWKTNVIASGGGTNDRAIRIWDVNSGVVRKEVSLPFPGLSR